MIINPGIRKSLNKEKLRKYNCEVLIPSYNLVKKLLNKELSHHLCKEKKINVPNTYFNIKEFGVKKNNLFIKKYKHDIKWKFKGYQQNSFEDIITYINSKNIHLSLVQVPVTKSRYKGYREKHKFDTYINKFSAYYNFNKLLDLNDTIHFYDTQHLNSKGVNLFNQAIKEQVLKK